MTILTNALKGIHVIGVAGFPLRDSVLSVPGDIAASAVRLNVYAYAWWQCTSGPQAVTMLSSGCAQTILQSRE